MSTTFKIEGKLARIANRFTHSRKMRELAGKYHKKNNQLLDWRKADLDRVYLDGLTLKRLDAAGSEGILVYARSAVLPRSNWTGSRLWSAYFLKADLRYASFKDCYLPYFHAWLANLHGADFRNAFIEGGDFKEADLTNADFTGADLTNCNFRGAKVGGIKLDNAVLDGVKNLDVVVAAETHGSR